MSKKRWIKIYELFEEIKKQTFFKKGKFYLKQKIEEDKLWKETTMIPYILYNLLVII